MDGESAYDGSAWPASNGVSASTSAAALRPETAELVLPRQVDLLAEGVDGLRRLADAG